MTLHEFHSIADDGRPQTFKQALKREIRRRRIQDEMTRAARASATTPRATRRLVIALRELRTACIEVVMACLIAAPIACGYVICLMVAWA